MLGDYFTDSCGEGWVKGGGRGLNVVRGQGEREGGSVRVYIKLQRFLNLRYCSMGGET